MATLVRQCLAVEMHGKISKCYARLAGEQMCSCGSGGS